MSMPRADDALLMNLEGTLEAGSGSSRPKPRFKRISSGSSSYRSSSSDTLWTHKGAIRNQGSMSFSRSVSQLMSQSAGQYHRPNRSVRRIASGFSSDCSNTFETLQKHRQLVSYSHTCLAIRGSAKNSVSSPATVSRKPIKRSKIPVASSKSTAIYTSPKVVW